MRTFQARHEIDSQGNSLLGNTTGYGLSVQWQGSAFPGGAEPIDLIAVAEDRLDHLQKTTSGGDKVARQLWEVAGCLRKLREIEEQFPQASALGAGSPTVQRAPASQPSRGGPGFGAGLPGS